MKKALQQSARADGSMRCRLFHTSRTGNHYSSPDGRSEGRHREAKLEEWHADFVFIGAHNTHGVMQFLLGGVARAVARLAACSVEIVRKEHRPRAAARFCWRPTVRNAQTLPYDHRSTSLAERDRLPDSERRRAFGTLFVSRPYFSSEAMEESAGQRHAARARSSFVG